MATIDRPSPAQTAAVGLGWPVEETPEVDAERGSVGLGWPVAPESLSGAAAPRAGERP